MKARAGAALLDLLTAVVLLGLVSVTCTSLVNAQARLLRNLSERAATDEALRTARAVLAAELRTITSRDVRGASADSIAVRVFRGWGVVCAADSRRVVMRYLGLREPDPQKDSLLIVGLERTIPFQHAADAGRSCPMRHGEQMVSIAAAPSLYEGAVVLLFESGSYHLSTNALRYRRGAEGRQPITDELIDHRKSRFDYAARGFALRLQSASTHGPAAVVEARVRLLNGSQ